MSDVVRNYTGSGGRIQSQRWRPRGSWLRRILLGFLAIVGVFAWITRDRYDESSFIPVGLRYNVVLADPMNGRERIASSSVWNAWPDPATRDKILAKIGQDPGLPRWILNNLVTQRLYLAGNDVREFSDVLAVTHMSRIGVLLERFHALVPGVTSDYAGGLRLRQIGGAGLYYAVRGRMLLVSPDRNALIRSLTLPSSDALDYAARENLARQGAEDLLGTVQLAPDDPLGDAFQSIAFAARIDGERAYAKCHAIIRDKARERFGPLLNGAKPYALAQPIPGPIEISANFGKPVREVWASLGEALQSPWLNAAQWQAWEELGPGNSATVPRAITEMVGPLGPAIRITCTGMDLNEMVPVPVLIGTLQVPHDNTPKLDAIPAPPAGAAPWDSYPRFDPEKKLVAVPMLGGPSIEPAAAMYGSELLIGTGRTAVEELLKSPPPRGTIDEQANLLVRIRPGAVVENVAGALRQFAEMNMLRGYTLDEFEAAAKGWLDSAGRVQEVVLIASGTDESIDVELRIICSPATDKRGTP